MKLPLPPTQMRFAARLYAKKVECEQTLAELAELAERSGTSNSDFESAVLLYAAQHGIFADAEPYTFTLNGHDFKWLKPTIHVSEIRKLCGVPSDKTIWERHPGQSPEWMPLTSDVFGDNTLITMDPDKPPPELRTAPPVSEVP